MPAPSLTDLCMKACIKNAANLRDIGNFEYWKIRPVLLRITNPEQLHKIEQASPQILGEDAELWKAFMARDIPSSKLVKDLKPDDPSQWWELYSEYLKQEQRAIKEDTERLREALMGIQKVKEKNVSKVMDAKYLPRLPKDGRMFANNGGAPISVRRGHGSTKKKPVAVTWTGSKSKIKDSATVLSQAKREAKVLSSRTRLNVPSRRLPMGTWGVPHAPKSMLEDYRRAAIPERKIYPATKNAPEISSGQSLEEREKRLRALTTSSRATKPISTREESSESELDDLFGERKSLSVSPEPKELPATPSKDGRPVNVISAIFFKGKQNQSSPPIPKPSTISGQKPQRSSPAQKVPSTERAASSPPSGPASPASADSTTATPTRKNTPPRRLATSPAAARARKRKPEVDVFNRTGTATKQPRLK